MRRFLLAALVVACAVPSDRLAAPASRENAKPAIPPGQLKRGFPSHQDALALVVEPPSVMTGQAFSLSGATLDASGWTLADGKSSGLTVQGANALMAGDAGFTVFVTVTPGQRNLTRETTVLGLENRLTNSGGIWIEPTAKDGDEILVILFFGAMGDETNYRLLYESFFDPTFSEATGIGTPMDKSKPHVIAVRYDRSKTGTERVAAFVDGVKWPIRPSWSGTSLADNEAPAPQLLSSAHDVVKFGPYSGYTDTPTSIPEYSPQALGAIYGLTVPMTDAEIAQAVAWIVATHPLGP